jgi:hypothetical protein
LAAKIERVLGCEWAERAVEVIAQGHQRELQSPICSGTHRGGGVRLSLRGTEHLAAARAAGRGVILWVVPTVAGPLVAKMALHGNGVGVHHLSHPHHGFSTGTWVGSWLLNPLRTGAALLPGLAWRCPDAFYATRIEAPLPAGRRRGAGPRFGRAARGICAPASEQVQ